MWNARTKDELMIEVWEKLDCESVGRPELEAIEVAVEAHFGKPAVDSPMVIARLLADEGAICITSIRQSIRCGAPHRFTFGRSAVGPVDHP